MTVIKINDVKYNTRKDIKFWNHLKEGKKSGLEGLYLLYSQDLFRYGMAILSDKELVKDGIQDLFIDLWKYRVNLNDTDNVRQYLCKSLTNRLIKIYQKEKARKQQNAYELKNIMYDNFSPGVSEIVSEHEMVSSQLQHALKKLPNRQKKVIQLVYFDQLSGKRVSRLMGINLQSVYNLTSKALLSLRKDMY